MCIENTLQQHILNITNGGKDIADFLYATMQGRNSRAQVHHQMEAAKHLTKLALTYTPSPSMGEGRDGGENPARPEPVERHDRNTAHENTPSPSTGEGWDGGEASARPEPVERHDGNTAHEPYHSSFLRKQESTLETADTAETQDNNPTHPVNPVTDTDIINYEIARLIREETNDGYAIAEFLTRIMHGSSPGELAYSLRDRVISPADRMAAAKELLNRGFGRLGQTRRAARQDDSDLVRSGLARYIRERTDHGLEAARLLLDAASGEDDSFSMRQRVAATRELIRRGWDTNYEAVTPADIVAYYERQDALEPTEYDDRLQEWQEQERAAQTAGATGRSSEEEPPQPDSGLFSHLTNAEINLYESMSAQEQTEFIEQQRARRARSQAEAGAVQPETAAATPAKRVPVSEQEAGIHTPNTQDDLIPAESDEATDEPDQDSENTDWNTLIQQITTPSREPHPVHPVPSRARSP